MRGSNSGTGGWSPSLSETSCDNLKVRANISSPQAPVLASLKIGDKLSLSLQQIPTVSVIVFQGQNIIGSPIGPQIVRLINCLENGFEFSATVVQLDGGNCVIDIEPKL